MKARYRSRPGTRIRSYTVCGYAKDPVEIPPAGTETSDTDTSESGNPSDNPGGGDTPKRLRRACINPVRKKEKKRIINGERGFTHSPVSLPSLRTGGSFYSTECKLLSLYTEFITLDISAAPCYACIKSVRSKCI